MGPELAGSVGTVHGHPCFTGNFKHFPVSVLRALGLIGGVVVIFKALMDDCLLLRPFLIKVVLLGLCPVSFIKNPF